MVACLRLIDRAPTEVENAFATSLAPIPHAFYVMKEHICNLGNLGVWGNMVEIGSLYHGKADKSTENDEP